MPNHIVTLHTQGNRVVAGDVQDSFHFFSYKHTDNQLYLFADDSIPRWITCGVQLDYDTMCGADKFGNVFVGRLPSETSEEVDEDTTGSRAVFERGYLQGAAFKVSEKKFGSRNSVQVACELTCFFPPLLFFFQQLEKMAEFYVGDAVTSLNKTTMTTGGKEVIVYATLTGGIGVLAPLASREEIDFFQQLEMQVRQEGAPLLGRDHLAFRSFYNPVKVWIKAKKRKYWSMGLTVFFFFFFL
jgi:splicing factor 3B subunit 3